MTLGCKVNQYDTEAMQEIMEAQGIETVDFSQDADIYLINTCTVTNIADRKSRQMIHRAARRGGCVIVCGCLSQRNSAEILSIEGVGAVIGTKNRSHIYEVAMRALTGEKVDAVTQMTGEHSFEPLHISKSGERTRGYIKICEGCDNFCSYCIIPYARGRVRSRSLEDILAEERALAQSGVKEVVLTGIHIGSYGKDIGGIGLIDVMEAADKVEGIERIRLGSLEPSLLTEDFCERASKLNKICRQFHLSLQSGSTSVLKRMNRRYTAEEFAEYAETLRRYFDAPALTTDIIAGFPGETEEEHEQTLAFIRRIGFARIHVFPYSEREGTKAAAMEQLPMSVRKRRAAEIGELSRQLEEEFAARFVGSDELVLFEQPSAEKAGMCEGLTDRHITVAADGAPNEIRKVRIISAKGGRLYGRCID